MARRPRTIGPSASDPGFSPQHALELVRSAIPPVHPAGRPFVGAGLALALAGRRHRWLRRAGLLAAGACAGFFRHPPRVPPARPGAIVAPADGEICVIDVATPPAELSMGDVALPRVSIFLSLLDAHVQRAPVSGEVIDVQHRPGRFGSADLAAASTENERTSLRIRTPGGAEVVAVQVAGLLARRIICDAHVGDKLSIGDTYGLIRFGSRLDTYLPAGAQPLVTVGQRAIAGETVLAELP
ncbi:MULTISPECIES: phosphatidylserine decarboxylase [Mycobacterium avium complex (MAC)]|uniref:phosphatidylserine decarboxylase n=1 Tax=Mycobacterium avium complex (MAC) TaxID=120793 RepID=UPI00044943FC|nr:MULTISPECIES: phosphatidylserine decarboxylase [Mycobacterium avium complex (MAC)]TXA41792.1 phosphatidylserine decarboxylase [Mycobacterium tuberculosis variant bovis]AYJ06990.1 phosphatidylserine decarboxylase [Mycobacterium avium]ETZ76430.1 phosphatidylserine decarboxylase family protein [Mycobacterium sp. MAC_011194_8550]MCA2293627.1 phosphatidylserine decarboxylase [Mycobacterium avium]MDV3263417.1 phosphatidylserine decarboxylase [Mycobacterium avium]